MGAGGGRNGVEHKLLSVDNLTSGDVKVSPGLLTLPKGQDSFMVTLRTSLEEVATTAPKSVVSLHAPWTVAFQGETVKLICNGLRFNSAQKATWYYWYHEGKMSSKTLSNTHVVHDSGEYRCQASDSLLSNSVRLLFSTANLILQAPLPVFEADSVVLRCRAKAGVAVNNMTLYKNDRFLASLHKTSDFHIHQADMKDSGKYRCSGFKEKCCSVTSNTVNIQVQELFPPPVLKARSSWPTKGKLVTLTCETQLPPQRSDVQLQFHFFKGGQILGSGWRSSPEFQITAIRREDSGSYSCEAQTVTSRVWKQSQTSQIYVQSECQWVLRFTGTGAGKNQAELHIFLGHWSMSKVLLIPVGMGWRKILLIFYSPITGVVANVQIHTRPALELVFEGQELVLTCSVVGVPGTVRISWYKGSNKQRMKTKIQNSLNAEFKISMVKNSDAGEYNCEASNGHLILQSKPVTINVKVPVSHPLLTLSPPRDRAFEGDVVRLQCEAQRGSFPIQYEFFHEGVIIKKIETTSWRESSFRFTLTAEHSGNYYCTADNGRGAKQSRAVHLSITIPVSHPVLTLSPPGNRVLEGEMVTLQCEAQRGSLPIQYEFFREGVFIKKIDATLRRTSSFRLNASKWCLEEADRSREFTSRTEAGGLRVKKKEGPPWVGGGMTLPGSMGRAEDQGADVVPVSHPVLTLSPPGDRVPEGEVMTLNCESQRGSLPIQYQFFREGVILKKIEATSRRTSSFSFSLTTEHSGNYYCTADNGQGAQRSTSVHLSITIPVSHPVLTLSPPGPRDLEGDMITLHSPKCSPLSIPLSRNFSLLKASANPSIECLGLMVPVSRPVLTLRAPRAQTVVGDIVELHCEAQRGSPPILYQFYHEDVTVGNSSAPSGGGSSFKLSLTEEHSGNYACEANNGLGAQRSDTVSLSVTVPVSRPVLTFRAPRAQAVVGDVVELHCETQRGSPPILYRFYHEDVILWISSTHSFLIIILKEYINIHDKKIKWYKRDETNIPVSRPVLTLRAPGAPAVVGDVVELHCEAQRGSPPILYQFYHENVTVGSSSAPSGGGASFNLSLTAEHSGNYSCEADNGLGAQRSEVVTLSITGATGSRSAPVATGVTGGLLSVMGLAAVALLFYYRLLRKPGGRLTSDSSRNPSNSDPQEPTYHNVPAWIELQPVYSNVNPEGGDVVYSEVRSIQEGKKHAVASTPGLLKNSMKLPASTQSPRIEDT
ncbi:hypothetical protein HPG69_006394 [Diceros bicornis minor]|uniref:Ig-like domain-containing protein n=1 Tax=Diceros bicornis minor TaxID=77932 RepID=A0A7J7EX01_DICBM|nr:hypothetical protein HPG69_006394 [Diceros bicornis minor]